MFLSLFISLPMIVCGVITAQLALALRHKTDRPRCWLFAWGLATTLLYTGHYIFFSHMNRLIPWSDTVYGMCNLAVYPLYLIYISELADTKPLSFNRWTIAALLCPSIICGGVFGVIYAMMSPEQTEAFLQIYLNEGTKEGLSDLAMTLAVAHDICKVIFSLEVVLVMVVGVKKVRDYHRKIDLLYADTEERSLHWVNIILVILVITSVLSLVVNRIGRQWFEDSLWMALPSFAFSSVIFAIGWIGLRRRPVAREIIRQNDMAEEDDIIEQNLAGKAVVDEAENLIEQIPELVFETQGATEAPTGHFNKGLPLMERLASLMEEQQLYLRHDLKLDEVAQMLGTNRTYLINALNEATGMSFKEYVNRFRIAFAKKLMEEHPEYSKNQIASLCGYTTPSSFYRNWKRYQ